MMTVDHRGTGLSDTPLEYAARGWHVFPLMPRVKRPAIGRWEARATTDRDRIRAAWSAGSYGVGLACGPSGLLVIDLDQPKPGKPVPTEHRDAGIACGHDALAALCEEAGEPWPPATYTVATPSGGQHLYYRQPTDTPLRSTTGRLGWLIDTRGHGGYVVAAGTQLEDGGYTVLDGAPVAELPGWLADRLAGLDHATRDRTAGPVQLNTGHLDRYLARAIERTVSHVLASPDEGHNKALFGAACSLGELVASGAVSADDVTAALLPAGVAVGQPERDALATIRSGLRHGAKRPRTLHTRGQNHPGK